MCMALVSQLHGELCSQVCICLSICIYIHTHNCAWRLHCTSAVGWSPRVHFRIISQYDYVIKSLVVSLGIATASCTSLILQLSRLFWKKITLRSFVQIVGSFTKDDFSYVGNILVIQNKFVRWRNLQNLCCRAPLPQSSTIGHAVCLRLALVAGVHFLMQCVAVRRKVAVCCRCLFHWRFTNNIKRKIRIDICSQVARFGSPGL